MTDGGDLGLGPYGSGPIAGTEQPVPTPGTPTSANVSKLSVYAIIDGSPDQESAAVGSLKTYAIIDASPDQESAGVAKLSVYAVLEAVVSAAQFPQPLFFPGAGPGLFGGARFQPVWAYDLPVIPEPIPYRRPRWDEEPDDEEWLRRRVFTSPLEPPPPGVEGLPYRKRIWLWDEEPETWLRRRYFSPPAEALGPDYPRVTKLIGYAVLDGSIEEITAAVTDLRAYGVLDHSSAENKAAVTDLRAYGLLDHSIAENKAAVSDLRGYGLLDGSVTEWRVGVTDFRGYGLLIPRFPSPTPPTPPRRFRMGVAEYTHTEGLADYQLRGALPDWGTFRSQLRDKQYIRYRARSGHIEEAGYGQFHWFANTVTRIRPLSGQLIPWGPGRRLIYKIDDYWTPPVGELVEALPSPTVVGIGEYTHTEGLADYELRGPIREWMSLALALHHNQRVLYRCHNSAKEEFGIGYFDAANNKLKRGPAGISSDIVDWGPGRKLIEILEKY